MAGGDRRLCLLAGNFWHRHCKCSGSAILAQCREVEELAARHPQALQHGFRPTAQLRWTRCIPLHRISVPQKEHWDATSSARFRARASEHSSKYCDEFARSAEISHFRVPESAEELAPAQQASGDSEIRQDCKSSREDFRCEAEPPRTEFCRCVGL